MASARSLTGTTAPRALLMLIQGNKGTILPLRALSEDSAGDVYLSLSINRLRHPPVLCQRVRCSAARGLATASRSLIKMDLPERKFNSHRWRFFSDNAGGYGGQFDVTGSLLDARREGRDCPLPGQFLAVSHTFGQEAVAAFATLAGDNNPIHLDAEYARSAGPRTYEGCIVHGLLVASLFPTVFGRTIVGSLYISQSLRFEIPVLVGERVDARIEIQQARITRMGREVLVRCSTVGCLADGSVAISGDAKVLLPRDWEVPS